MLTVGIEGKGTVVVAERHTARVRASGTLDVFATPAMIELIEETAWKSVAGELEEGCATVGTSLQIKHLSATPVGMQVTCKTQLKEVDGRRLLFEVAVEDEVGRIGEGTHERFVIQAEKFQKKADGKKKA
ncbi:MAG: thioesterase family protein [Eubacterium sp.]|jgi:fluoroacetyl-CoA thioesterase|nr:thioesterase family protein [Eubacterium sp.]NBI86637.1 thioesterase [Lachnospiraceae bacterium]